MATKFQPERDEKYATAMHEAGHAVAAILRGIGVGRVNIIGETLPDGRTGLGFNDVAYPKWQSFVGQGREAVRPILVTLYAGAHAEECVNFAVNTRPYSF